MAQATILKAFSAIDPTDKLAKTLVDMSIKEAELNRVQIEL